MGSSSRIGENIPRIEDAQLLRGEGCFLDDVEVGADVLHACFVRSSHAHARIEGIDVSAARGARGVVAVLSAADVAATIKPIEADGERDGFKVTRRTALAVDTVRFVGDTVAMVIATDPYAALDAAELVDVAYEPLPPVIGAVEALRPDAPRVHAELPDNVLYEGSFGTPEFAARHGDAPFRVRERFETARMAAVPMEPRGCLAKFDRRDRVLCVWSSTQIPHLLQGALAEHLGLLETEIRVIAPDVGGGFGMKAVVYPEELLVAAAAIRLGRPVKWVQDRYDDLLTSAQARDHTYEVEVGFDEEGVLVSLQADVVVNVGAYPGLPLGSSLEANGAPRNMPGPYRLAHLAYRTRAVATHTCPSGPYRGVSAPLACFVMEGLMDRIARHRGVDPAELRRRNLIREFPYKNVLGQQIQDGCFLPLLERALEMADYPALRSRQAAERQDLTLRKRSGIGVAVITEQTGMGAARYKARGNLRISGFEGAAVSVAADGAVVARVSQAAQGQGHATAFAQIVSDQLGVPITRIRIIEGDTGQVPAGTGTLASRGIVIAGNALLQAAGTVRDKMARIAATLFECSAEDIRFADGHARIVGVPEPCLEIREIAARAHSRHGTPLPPGESFGLEATIFYDPPALMVAAAAHVAVITLDTLTGQVSVDDYAVAHDCGRMVNPTLVDGQILGGVVQGLGEVLMEQFGFDETGQPTTVSLMDYHLPRSPDLKRIRIDAVHTEAGGQAFKGVGEGGTIGAVPALANAVADALADRDVSLNWLPLTAESLHAVLAHHRGGDVATP